MLTQQVPLQLDADWLGQAPCARGPFAPFVERRVGLRPPPAHSFKETIARGRRDFIGASSKRQFAAAIVELLIDSQLLVSI